MNIITDVNGDQINPDRRYNITLTNEGKKSVWRRYPHLSGKLTFNVNVIDRGDNIVFEIPAFGRFQIIQPLHCETINPI